MNTATQSRVSSGRETWVHISPKSSGLKAFAAFNMPPGVSLASGGVLFHCISHCHPYPKYLLTGWRIALGNVVRLGGIVEGIQVNEL